MSTRDLDAQITAHYSSDDLTQAILTALAAAGKAEGRPYRIPLVFSS